MITRPGNKSTVGDAVGVLGWPILKVICVATLVLNRFLAATAA